MPARVVFTASDPDDYICNVIKASLFLELALTVREGKEICCFLRALRKEATNQGMKVTKGRVDVSASLESDTTNCTLIFTIWGRIKPYFSDLLFLGSLWKALLRLCSMMKSLVESMSPQPGRSGQNFATSCKIFSFPFLESRAWPPYPLFLRLGKNPFSRFQ